MSKVRIIVYLIFYKHLLKKCPTGEALFTGFAVIFTTFLALFTAVLIFRVKLAPFTAFQVIFRETRKELQHLDKFIHLKSILLGFKTVVPQIFGIRNIGALQIRDSGRQEKENILDPKFRTVNFADNLPNMIVKRINFHPLML